MLGQATIAMAAHGAVELENRAKGGRIAGRPPASRADSSASGTDGAPLLSIASSSGEGAGVTFVDYVEDRVRSRALSVLLLTAIFLIATGSLVALAPSAPTAPHAAVFASAPPRECIMELAISPNARSSRALPPDNVISSN